MFNELVEPIIPCKYLKNLIFYSNYLSLLSQAQDFYELTEGTEWIKFLDADINGKFQVLRVTVRKVVSFFNLLF